jgi:hypothetical protein
MLDIYQKRNVIPSNVSLEERTAFSGGINGLFWEKVP